jgi:hypothetical protein
VSDSASVVAGASTGTAYAVGSRITYAPIVIAQPHFAPRSASTLVAYSLPDAAVVLVHLPALSTESLVARRDGLATAPAGLAFSHDAASLWIADPQRPALIRYTFDSRSVTEHPVPLTGTLSFIGNAGVYQWTADALLDTNRSVPTVLTVPTRIEEGK